MFTRSRCAYPVLAASVSAIALSLQLIFFVLWAQRHGMGVAYGIWNYFSYFTNLTNLFGAVALAYALRHGCNPAHMRRQASPMTGVAVMLVVTCLVYNFVLRQTYHSQSLSLLADILLHDVCPALYLGFWWYHVPHGQLGWSDAMKWLIFPVAYFFYILLRGMALGHYPYPFLDAHRLGYFPVLANGLEMLAGILVISIVLVASDRLKPARVRPNS